MRGARLAAAFRATPRPLFRTAPRTFHSTRSAPAARSALAQRGPLLLAPAAAALAWAFGGCASDRAADGTTACAASPATPRLEDDYEIYRKDVLGEGTFGVVFRGKCRKTGKMVAIKVLNRDKTDVEVMRREVEVLRRVGMHRSVAALEGFYETADCFYLVMEFVSGGELFEHLCEVGAYSEAQAASVLKEVASGVALLHAQGLCHADIKPENLLLTSKDQDAHVKLVDFGLSCSPREASKRKPGTWAYWPPEAVRCPASIPWTLWVTAQRPAHTRRVLLPLRSSEAHYH